MNFRPFTVSSFFGQAKTKYTIPDYQRAYSWEKNQWEQFYDDLYEHRNCTEESPYCYGNVLLETIKQNSEYGIIDGQQRITTLSIFVRAILNVIAKRKLESEKLSIADEERIYFKDYGIIKLHPVQYDEGCYQAIVIENKPSFNCETPSQRRMVVAKRWFYDKLNNLSDNDLLAVFRTLERAVLYVIELNGSKESALMFELQNNRGKKLTNLESLKSYFMYQLYVYSKPEEIESNIKYISGLFGPIYKISNDLNELLIEGDFENEKYALSEDNVLLYHAHAYSRKNFAYRNIEDIIDEFKDVDDSDKVKWIKEFSLELYTSFKNIKKLLSLDNPYLIRLRDLGMPTFIYPFIIKGMKYTEDGAEETMSSILRTLEVLSFRYKLVGSRADIRSRLSEVIKSFDGNPTSFASSLSQKMNDAYYWGDEKVEEVLNGYMYNNAVLHYILWEYESSLYNDGYKFSQIEIDDESIEHISPQTENDEGVEAGYEVETDGFYTEEFRNNYLNKIGNLMLISKSHNSSIGNKPFKDKLKSYKEHPVLKQQMAIETYSETDSKGNPKWGKASIDKRQADILTFALNRWKFD